MKVAFRLRLYPVSSSDHIEEHSQTWLLAEIEGEVWKKTEVRVTVRREWISVRTFTSTDWYGFGQNITQQQLRRQQGMQVLNSDCSQCWEANITVETYRSFCLTTGTHWKVTIQLLWKMDVIYQWKWSWIGWTLASEWGFGKQRKVKQDIAG